MVDEDSPKSEGQQESVELKDLPTDRHNAHQRTSLGSGNHRENRAPVPVNNEPNLAQNNPDTGQNPSGASNRDRNNQGGIRQWLLRTFCCGRGSKAGSVIVSPRVGGAGESSTGGSNGEGNAENASETSSPRSLISHKAGLEDQQGYGKGNMGKDFTRSRLNLLPPLSSTPKSLEMPPDIVK